MSTAVGTERIGKEERRKSMLVVVEKTGQDLVVEGDPLARGGEAAIYPLPGSTDLLAKIYHRPTAGHAEKLAAMIAAPPDDPMLSRGHVSIAWPLDRILATGPERRCIGYVMRHVEKARPIIEFYNPRSRLQICPQFHYGYLLRTARNLAAAFRAVHERGYVIGDVNESNILATIQALVTLVDTDSFQVRVDARVHRCLVGKMEYTPPELQGARFADVDRTPEHDVFGLAVLIFQLLMQGMHPFAGVYTGQGEPPSVGRRIADGMWPYARARNVPYFPNPHAPPLDVLPASVQELMRRCFETGHAQPSARPDALSWQRALQEGETELGSCSANGQHVFPALLKVCPWCELTRRHKRDPFPPRDSTPKDAGNLGVAAAGAREEILEALPADPVPIPPVPRTKVVEVEPVVLPETLPVIEVRTKEYAPAESTFAKRAADTNPNGRRTRLNTQKIDAAALPSPLRSNVVAWTALIAGMAIVIVVVLIILIRQRYHGREDRNVLKGHEKAVNCLAFSPDGSYALSGSDDGTIRYWQLNSDKNIDTFLAGAPVRCLAFRPRSDKQAISGGTDGKLRLWDLDKLTKGPEFLQHTGPINGLAFVSDTSLLLSGGTDGILRLTDVSKPANLAEVWKSELQREITSVAVSADGKRAACGCSNGTALVWAVEPGAHSLNKVGDEIRHNAGVTALAFSPDGKYLFSASKDRTAKMWDSNTLRRMHSFEGHKDAVEALSVSRDGDRLLTAGRDHTVRLWDTRNGSELYKFIEHTGPVLTVAFSPDGSYGLSAGDDRVIRRWLLPQRK